MREKSPHFGRSTNQIIYFIVWFFSFNILFQELPITIISAQPLTQVKIGVVVDMEKSVVGKMAVSCINMALSDFYSITTATHGGAGAHYKTRLLLHTRDSRKDVVAAAAAALDLIKNVQVQAILGPSTSMEAKFVIELGQKAAVPIISFSATSPSLTSIRSPYFFQAAQVDSTQVGPISAIVETFGWREAVPIYVDNEYGKGIIPYLIDAFEAVNVRVPYRSTISPMATDEQISQELYKLMTMPTRVFILHMLPPSLGFRLLSKAKENGMMKDGFVWIMTDGITVSLPSSSPDPSVFDSMQGVLGIKPYVLRTQELLDFRNRWKRKFLQENPDIVDPELQIYGLWAYDAAIALAMAVEQAGISNFSFQMQNASGNSSSDLETFEVSQNGPNLIQALSNISFKGLAGDFSFVEGKLQSSAFQIVNVNGNGERGIGFWTPKKGLFKQLEFQTNTTSSTYATPNSSLAPIIWPGDSTSVPKGWQIPTNGKRLRVGVPVKHGFSQFVKVTRDPASNSTRVSGYCIDVFDAVIQALPYSVAYDYIPFANPDGEMAGTYDDLINQVYLGVYDIVVGDVTIVGNRSLYVDFTLPYTDSRVSMVVPFVDKQSKNAWVFLIPLTWELWVTSFCFFIFIGFVVWVLEHRINEDFRGPPSYQAGTSFWFSFSTLVFTQREKVVSNLARVVVLIWCFVVLILTQSYTASLTSLLTVQKLQPTVTDVDQLIRNGDYVGYVAGSFVLGKLKRMGFDESKLLVYRSPEECDELFSKGSGNGGIAAAFHEAPYIKIFLGQYCSKYTRGEPIFSTAGLGFVFPKGSPLVSDVSRAVLQAREGDKMKQIEDAWFLKQHCPDSTTSVSSSSLGLQSFWGLFLIAGLSSVLALLIFLGMFLYENWKILMPQDSRPSIWSRIRALLRIFNQKDMKSHNFRNIVSNPPSIGAPSPTSYHVHTDFPGDSPSAEYGEEYLEMQDSRQVFFRKAGDKAPQELAVNINQTSSSSQGRITEIDSIDENMHRKEAQEFYFDRPSPKGIVIHTG